MKTIEQILEKINQDIKFLKNELRVSETAYHFGDEKISVLSDFENKINLLEDLKKFIEEND